MIYGYNSKLQSRGINTILDYGAEFMEELKKVRCTPKEIKRPLILIGRSFGGLIIAHTLVKAKHANESGNPTIAALYSSIYAMMFFGTPHSGLVVDDIWNMLGEDPSNPRAVLLEEIRFGSQRLADQLVDFKNLIRHRKIVSFVEMQQTRRLGIIANGNGSWSRSGDFITTANPQSVMLQLPDHEEVKIRVDADHSSIVKFDTRHNPTYQSALRCLREFEHAASQLVSSRIMSSVTQTVAESTIPQIEPQTSSIAPASKAAARLPKEAVARSGATIVHEPC